MGPGYDDAPVEVLKKLRTVLKGRKFFYGNEGYSRSITEAVHKEYKNLTVMCLGYPGRHAVD